MRNVCHGKLFIRVALSFLFVFILASTTFATTETKLLASDSAESDWFGHAVSISGDVALVGAELDGDKGTYSGAAYVFRWNGSAWAEEDKLLASDGLRYDFFGFSVSISGDVALVGAYGDDDSGTDAGAAYVFRWNGESWEEEDKLLASDGAAGDQFGHAVSISGNVALVGASWDDDRGADSGAAYVFRWNGSSWEEEDKLLASDGAAGDQFGHAVSISGNVALVGAYLDDDSGTDAGAAYVFRWNGSSWLEEQKLLASDGDANDRFGSSVSISGDVALVGAFWDDDNSTDAGAAYLFKIVDSSTPNKAMPWIPLLLLEN
jgi:hypothetical protein